MLFEKRMSDASPCAWRWEITKVARVELVVPLLDVVEALSVAISQDSAWWGWMP